MPEIIGFVVASRMRDYFMVSRVLNAAIVPRDRTASFLDMNSYHVLSTRGAFLKLPGCSYPDSVMISRKSVEADAFDRGQLQSSRGGNVRHDERAGADVVVTLNEISARDIKALLFRLRQTFGDVPFTKDAVQDACAKAWGRQLERRVAQALWQVLERQGALERGEVLPNSIEELSHEPLAEFDEAACG